jgi:hypothetical protein
MQKMIWTPRESDLPPLVHSTMHLPDLEVIFLSMNLKMLWPMLLQDP